jgi:hypothetical protein
MRAGDFCFGKSHQNHCALHDGLNDVVSFKLPAVTAADVQRLSDSAYTAIVNRERGYKGWALKLEAIIKANNAKAGQ